MPSGLSYLHHLVWCKAASAFIHHLKGLTEIVKAHSTVYPTGQLWGSSQDKWTTAVACMVAIVWFVNYHNNGGSQLVPIEESGGLA